MTIQTSQSIENIASALGKFQAETHGVVRDASNPYFKSRYATLEAVIETARPGLTKAGLAFLQAPAGLVGNSVELETLLMHSGSGEWIRFTTAVPLQKPDPQGVGSAITYACRYALMAMLGLPPLDDDAEATKPQPKEQSDFGYAPRQALQELAQPGIAESIVTEKPQTFQEMAIAADQIRGIQGIPSKEVYLEKAIKRMGDFDSASKLLQWAKDERTRVWPQYSIDAYDEDAQRFIAAYKSRMVELAPTPEMSE